MTTPGEPGRGPAQDVFRGSARSGSALTRASARTWTTKVQVSGWRFMFHRLEHALVRYDTAMEQDPMRSTSRAFVVGAVFSVLLAVGCVIFAFLMPKAQMKDADIVADKVSGGLYVRINGQLHPVLNLTSAQLIVGSPKKPVFVKSSELETMPRGPLVGIPGAPDAVVDSSADVSESAWAVCDATTPAGKTEVTVIGTPVVVGDGIGVVPEGTALLARLGEETSLIYDGHLTPIDLEDKAVTLAVGMDASTPAPMPISRALHDALAQTPPLVVPAIPEAGTPSTWDLGASVVIGSVIRVPPVDRGEDAYYVVLPDGVQRITAVAAAIIRNADPRNPPPPREVAPNALLTIPTSRMLPVDFYPVRPLKFVDPVAQQVTCLSWVQSRTETKARTAVLSGRQLPLRSSARPVSVVTRDPNGGTANAVFIPPGSGRYVQVAGGAPDAVTGESLWWVADRGVRFGLVSETSPQNDPAVSLGLDTPPLPAPWSILRLLPAGPALSKADALMSHDSLPVDPRPKPVAVSHGG